MCIRDSLYVNAFTSVKVFAKVCTNQPAFRCTANKQAEADQAPVSYTHLQMMDAVASGDQKRAMKLYRDLLELRESAMSIFCLLYTSRCV